MKELMIANKELTMSSLEIAELLGARHDSVKRSIERLANAAIIVAPPLVAEQFKDSMGRRKSVEKYVFSGEQGKRDSIIVVAQLSPEFTARLVDRWQELENQNKLQLPNFNDPAEAARAWADQFEQRAIAEKKLEDAKPAIEFVDKYVQSDQLFSFRQVCKLLKAKENAFRSFLVESRVMYKLGGSWTAYANHLDAGRFEVKTGINSATGTSFETTYFTSKGLEWIAGEWGKHIVSESKR